MKKIIGLFYFLFLAISVFGQQFRMVANMTTFPVLSGSEYTLSVSLPSDQTSNNFIPTQIPSNGSYRIFFQNGNVYTVTTATNVTLFSADLLITPINGASTPSGQGIIYDPDGRETVPFVPVNALGASPMLDAAISSYNILQSVDLNASNVTATAFGDITSTNIQQQVIDVHGNLIDTITSLDTNYIGLPTYNPDVLNGKDTLILTGDYDASNGISYAAAVSDFLIKYDANITVPNQNEFTTLVGNENKITYDHTNQNTAQRKRVITLTGSDREIESIGESTQAYTDSGRGSSRVLMYGDKNLVLESTNYTSGNNMSLGLIGFENRVTFNSTSSNGSEVNAIVDGFRTFVSGRQLEQSETIGQQTVRGAYFNVSGDYWDRAYGVHIDNGCRFVADNYSILSNRGTHQITTGLDSIVGTKIIGTTNQVADLSQWLTHLYGDTLVSIKPSGRIDVKGIGDDAKIRVIQSDTQTNNLIEAHSNVGVELMAIKSDGSVKPASMDDASATNNSIYYSTTLNKLVYKDNSGVVNALY